MPFATAKPIDFDAYGTSIHYGQARNRERTRSFVRQSVNVSRETVIKVAQEERGSEGRIPSFAYTASGVIPKAFAPGLFIAARA